MKNRAKSVCVLGLCVVFLFGCDGGELTSTPAIPQFPPPTEPRTDLVGVEGAMELNDLASQAAVKALSIVKEIRTSKDVERNIPIFMQYMNEMLTCNEQMEDIISGLDRNETLQVNRHILADTRQETSAKAIKVEMQRISPIKVFSRQVIAEIKAKDEQFKKRSEALTARVTANTQRHTSAPTGMESGSGFPTDGPPPGFGGMDGPPPGFGGMDGPPPGFGAGSGSSAPSTSIGISDPDDGGNPFAPAGEPGTIQETLDPDDLVEIAKSGDIFAARDALIQLAAADASEAAAETRKTVSLALKNIAFDASADNENRELAIQGMVVWAGKYAAPQLMQFLKRPGDHFFDRKIDEAALRALGRLKHPDTLEPIAIAFANGAIDGEAAAECLIQFGADAEPYVLKHCRPGNSRHSENVVYILGKIGTKKSLPALKALLNMRGGGIRLRELAIQAARAIQEREKQQGGAKESNN